MPYLVMLLIITTLPSTFNLMEFQHACQINSCVHGVCKPSSNDSYECFCENGYTGYHCGTNYNDCVSFPCQNDAYCVDLVAGVQCICQEGFTGSLCESVLDHCSSHPCKNGGTCYDFQDGFNCSCGIGFDGQNCEVDIDVCTSLEFQQLQCFNGGTCIEGVGLSFTCSCASGFEGPRCETNVDECLSYPCRNNGTCVDELDGFSCVCSYRWTGTYCELEQEMCQPEVCSNRGLCVGNATDHVCYCIPDFHGPSCQWRYDECLPKPRCFHGGTCVDGVDDFMCSCLPGFIGKHCEIHCYNNCSVDDGGSSSLSLVDSYWTDMEPTFLATLESFWESQFATIFLSSQDAEFNSPTMMESLAETATSGSHRFNDSHSDKDDSSWLEFQSYTGQSNFPSEYYTELTSSFEMPESLATTFDPEDSPFWSSWAISDISPSFLSWNSDLTDSTVLPARESNWWSTPTPHLSGSSLSMTPFLSTSWSEPEETLSNVIVSLSGVSAWWQTIHFQTSSAESPSFSGYISTESSYSNFPPNRSFIDETIKPTSSNSYWSTLPYGTSEIDTDQYDMWTLSANTEPSQFYLISSDLMWSDAESMSDIAFDGSTPRSIKTLDIDDWQSHLRSSQFFHSISVMFTPVPEPSLPFFTAIPRSSDVSLTSPVKTDLLTDVVQFSTSVSSSLMQTTLPLSSKTPIPPYDSNYFECSNTTCQNNGICQLGDKDLESFKCHCRLMFGGPYCEQKLKSIEIPSFDGSSYLIYDLRSYANGTGDFTVKLTFESIEENGIIFYVDLSPTECQETFVMLETENGLTLLSFSCGSQSIVSMEEGLRVDDGSLHTIAVGMQWYHNALNQVICNVSMQLDQWPPLTGQQHDVPSLCHVTHLHLGGVHKLPHQMNNNNELNGKVGFTGCVIAATVNDRVLNLLSGADDGFNIQECNSVLCASRICQHGSSCHNISKTAIECDCPAGFTGQFCELHQCPDSVCQSGGTCLPTRTKGSVSRPYICLCPLGFQGLYCEQAQNKMMEEMAFSGSFMGYSSFIAVPLPISNERNSFEAKINFVPEDSSQNELLFFVGQDGLHLKDSSFVAVGLIGNSVVMQCNLGTGADMLRYDGQIRTDRNHHLVTFGFNDSFVWMRIDNQTESSISAVTTNRIRFVDQFGSSVYIGGHAAYNFTMLPEILPSSGFTGCITDVHINDVRVTGLQMGDESVFGRNIRQCSIGKCPLSCRNGGTCVSLGTSFMCLCPAGWIGPLCSDLFDPCDGGTHHCSPNSDCIVQGQGYRCDCSLGWTGTQCDQGLNFTTPYFNGVDSFIAFQPHNIRHQLTLRVQFQPLSPNGVLFYTAVQLKEGSSDFACLTLDEGYVEFRYNLGGGRFSTIVLRSRNKVNVLNTSWHTVDVWQRGNEATLTVDGKNVTGQALTGMVTLDTETNFYLGGLPNMDFIAKAASEKLPVPFHGCIRLFSVNGIPYPLSTQGPVGGRNIGNCSSPSTGFFDTCANGGTCIHITQDTCQCICLQPFTGPNCLDVLPCYFHVCQNGGICIPIESPDVQLQYGVPYSCDCPLGWMGQYCEEQSSEITEARFRGNGYILVADDNYPLSDRTRNRIALNFSTTIGNGLLLWTGVEPNFDDDYLAVGLEYGQLKVAWNLGWFSRSQLLVPLDPAGETLADSKWHTAVVYREKQRVSIKLDEAVFSANTPGSFTELNTLGVYYIGGLPHGANFTFWTNSHFHAGFAGCIKNVELSESKRAIDFMGAVSGSNVLQC